MIEVNKNGIVLPPDSRLILVSKDGDVLDESEDMAEQLFKKVGLVYCSDFRRYFKEYASEIQ